MRKIIYFLTFLLGLTVIMPTSVAVASEVNDTQSEAYEEAYHLATIISENTHFNESEKILTFDVENSIEQGLDESTAVQMENYYSSLSPEEAEQVYDEILSSSYSTRSVTVTSLLVAAGKILAKAGLGWLAKKLYDWGAEKFCANYKNYNGVTQNVCDFLGY